MNFLAVGAAGLLGVLGVAHSYLGERYLLGRLLRRSHLPRLFGNDTFTKHILRLVWHLTTVAWWGLAAILAYLATEGGLDVSGVALVVTATCAASAMVILVGSRGRHAAWIVFVAVAGMTWFAFR